MGDRRQDNVNIIGSMISVLLAVFGGLKVCGVLQISWWWVFSPLWLPLAAIALVWGILIVSVILDWIIRRAN